MKRTFSFSPLTVEAARVLGSQIRLARTQRRWTVAELAERVGTSSPTVQKIERGDPTVGLGLALEAAVLTGVTLFSPEPDHRRMEARHIADRLALLPQAVRAPVKIDDEF
ncbi:MAG TPA: helix-turn-helix transcriptional regulator [Acidimicrobiales bacterium]|nr:helix-turn-helix transcriptional regulator [Acidimicrobiales bacterium]